MHLVQPLLLIADIIVPDIAINAYAKVLCSDFARWIGLPVPRLRVTDQVPFDRNLCQSPCNELACLVNGESLVASELSDVLELQFLIAHTLMHQVPNIAEWECDLPALDWMNCLDMPILESTACAIAQTPGFRAKALQFMSGQHIVAIGDALVSQVWDLPVLQIS